MTSITAMQHKKDKKFVVLDRTPSTPQRNVAKRKRSTMGMVEIIYDCSSEGKDREGKDCTAVTNVNALHEQIECFMPLALIGQGDFFNVYLIKRNVAQRFDFNTDINDALRRRDCNEGIDCNERRDCNEKKDCNNCSITPVINSTANPTTNPITATLTTANHTTNPIIPTTNHTIPTTNSTANPLNIMDSSLSALKVSAKALTTTTQTNDYHTEIRILKALRNSPHILKLRRAWCINSYLYIETEHCNLGSFLNLVEYVYKLRKSVLSERFVVYFMMEVCAALVEMKRMGVMHCDVAPGNVLMCGEGGGEHWMEEDVGEYVRWYCDTRGYVINDGGGCNGRGEVRGNERSSEGCDNERKSEGSGNSNDSIVNDRRGSKDCNSNGKESVGKTTNTNKRRIKTSPNNAVPKTRHPPLKITFKLADFNISKFAHSPLQQEGTPRYLPKEALKGHYYHSSDLFSLALIWLEIKEGIDLPSNGTSWHDLRNGSFTCDSFDEHDEKVLRNVLGVAEDRMDVESVYAYFKGKYERYDG